MADRIKQALNNLDSVVAEVRLTRVEHLQLVSDLECVQAVCKEHAACKEEVKEPEEKDE